MLPFTPITEELLRPEWVQEEYPVVAEAYNRGDLSEEWKVCSFKDCNDKDPDLKFFGKFEFLLLRHYHSELLLGIHHNGPRCN